MSQNFVVSNENPNDEVGGGGCLCSEERTEDCIGPFVIFPSAETSSNSSPHAVVCSRCITDAAGVLDAYEKPQLALPAPDEVIELPESEVEEITDDESIPKV